MTASHFIKISGILHKYFTLSETIPYLKGVSPKKCKLLFMLI